jgi:hypothetical protein
MIKFNTLLLLARRSIAQIIQCASITPSMSQSNDAESLPSTSVGTLYWGDGIKEVKADTSGCVLEF